MPYAPPVPAEKPARPRKAEKPDQPCHVVAVVGDDRTLCGKPAQGDRATYPQVLAAHVQAHVEGHGMIMCEDCLAVAVPLPPSANRG